MTLFKQLGQSCWLSLLLFTTATNAWGAVLTPSITKNLGGHVEGIALGDIDGDGRKEIAITLRSGTYTHSTPDNGSLALLNQSLDLIWSYAVTDQVVGYPVAGDFDGDGMAEFAFCTNDVPPFHTWGWPGYSKCYAIDGNGTRIFSTRDLGFPGMTNGGPAVADINGDGYDDLVVASYFGELLVALGPMGNELWYKDMLTQSSEQPYFFGHPTIADLEGDGNLEIIIGGTARGYPSYIANDGGLFVLNARTGAIKWSIARLGQLAQNPTPDTNVYFLSSGPSVGNFDSDAELEIAVLVNGSGSNNHALIVFEPNGSVASWTAVANSIQVGYSSPIAVDGDGDGAVEFYIVGGNGTAHYKEGSSALVSLGQIGSIAGSWTSPGMIDLTGNGLPDLLLANTQQFYIYNPAANYSVIHSYAGTARGLYPSPIISDINSDGKAELLSGGWSPRQLYLFHLSEIAGYDWNGHMGSARHTGWLKANDPANLLSTDPAISLYQLYNHIDLAMVGKSGTQLNCLTLARSAVLAAWQHYMRGNPHTALSRLSTTGNNNCTGTSTRGVMRLLNLAQAAGANVTYLRQETAYIGAMMFKDYVDRAAGTQAPDPAEITTAISTFNTAMAAYDAANYDASIQSSASGAAALRTYLDSSSYFSNPIENDCPIPPTHVYHTGMCKIEAALTMIIALPDNSSTTNAETYTRRAIAWMPDIVLLNVFNGSASGPGMIGAESTLASWDATATAAIRLLFAQAGQILAREFIDDIIAWRGATHANVVSAESLYTTGLAQLNAANYAAALTNFRDAISAAAGAI